jgi:hypothetical protein
VLLERDLLEVTFLLDYFRTNEASIAEWRGCTESERNKKFGAYKVRTALDDRDGFTEQKREERYKRLCTLIGLRDLFCCDDGPWPANAEMSLRRRILGSRLRGWFDQRDREPFIFAISVRRAPLAPTLTIGQATPLEGPSGA